MKNGTILNHTYRIIKPIAAGGLGDIYLGYHENLKKDVVIKKVKSHCSCLLNNRIEVDILKSLHHTYLPQVYDFIETEDGIFTVMDYIPGYDLKYYINQGYQFSEEQLLTWMKQLCEVLEYLHSRQPKIIHCDIKPGNIMITNEGNVCLIDFNISLDGENNKELVGLSSFFASPEQVKKAEYKQKYGTSSQIKMDERADIYSLGAVFYYLMCGKTPNVRTGDTLLLREMPHSYSDSLANIVDKAMEQNPAKRFRSAAKMLSALQNQEKWTTEYMRLWKCSILLDSVAVSMGLILLCFSILGYRGMKRDAYFLAYDVYNAEVKQWMEQKTEGLIYTDDLLLEDADRIVSEGIRLLNESDYESFFENNPEHKAEILHWIGLAALDMKKYEQASLYLKDSLKYVQDDVIVYRDLAVVEAKNGKIRSAKSNLDYAIEHGLSKEEGFLLKTEIAMSQEDYNSAWEYVQEAVRNQDDTITQRAACYVLQIEEQTGNTDACIAFLIQQQKQATGMNKYIWMRKIGELYLKLYENGSKKYLSEALKNFESIYESNYVQLNDMYNLASCYMESGYYSKAKKLLLDMQDDYPKEYKIFMRLAYVILSQENKKSITERNYRKVKEYFNKAKNLCVENGIQWEKDTNMVQLKEMLRQLKTQGWLN